MQTQTDTEEKTGTATYSPEDNKLRLYVGRVPRNEYLALRNDGWTSTPKQACDFVATWTPQRRDTCLQYAELIEDEDQGPEDRAADRAERFGEYRDKRTGEATGHADNYDAGPTAHGYQSQARAERSARRHDRQASYACDAWSKAEYWTQRTAGVIRHALYKSTPGVRMGRIKVLEAELRRYAGSGGEWEKHLTLRLAYENQMLEAQGGRAAFVEMIPGGFIGKHQIYKVNKSTATGRVVSVNVKTPTHGRDKWGNEQPNAPEFRLVTVNTERLPADAYRAPTDPELEAFNAERKAEKAARPVTKSLLINPTDADGERLQAIWNARKVEYLATHKIKHGWAPDYEPSTVCKVTQATYSAASKGGAYARAETRGLCCNAEIEPRFSNLWTQHAADAAKRRGPKVAEIRVTHGKNYQCDRVIVITDKPQKPLPLEVWEAPKAQPELVLQ